MCAVDCMGCSGCMFPANKGQQMRCSPEGCKVCNPIQLTTLEVVRERIKMIRESTD